MDRAADALLRMYRCSMLRKRIDRDGRRVCSTVVLRRLEMGLRGEQSGLGLLLRRSNHGRPRVEVTCPGAAGVGEVPRRTLEDAPLARVPWRLGVAGPGGVIRHGAYLGLGCINSALCVSVWVAVVHVCLFF